MDSCVEASFKFDISAYASCFYIGFGKLQVYMKQMAATLFIGAPSVDKH